MRIRFPAAVCLLLFITHLCAQNIGIGTDTPDPSAKLEIASDSSGLLIPCMTSTDRDAISDPATGLLVFVTTDSAFYYFDGSAWTTLDSRTRVLVDADLDTRVEVEQNTDDDTIRFTTAGTEFFTMNNGRLAVRNTGESVFIGEEAGLNDDLTNNRNVYIGQGAGKETIDGFRNIGIGTFAMLANTSGAENTAIGYNTMRNNLTGNSNTAYGYNALFGNISGSENVAVGLRSAWSSTDANNLVAIGDSALFANQVMGNTAIGSKALQTMTLGANNTALGFRAGQLATGSGNIFIGHRAGLNATGDSTLYIENTASDSPLIYGDFGRDSVIVNGKLEVEGAFVVNGSGNATGVLGSVPDYGTGTRLMWVPSIGAIRIGYVTGDGWSPDSLALGSLSAVIGGFDNVAIGGSSLVTGGNLNRARGVMATVVGGSRNISTGQQSAVIGGGHNSSIGATSFIGGGTFNSASGVSSFIGGGDNNDATGDYTFVGGGMDNDASGNFAFIGGGFDNEASGDYAFVSSGTGNDATGFAASIGGGSSNSAAGQYAHVGGGLWNNANGNTSFIGGGVNLIAPSYGETVIGTYNTEYTAASTSTVDTNDRVFTIGIGSNITSRANALVVKKSGKVGIGSDNPGTLLEVNGTASKPGGGDWAASSDMRLKRNVSKYQDGLEQILKIRSVNYQYNTESQYDTTAWHVGIIAQEMQAIAPYTISQDPRGYLMADNSALTFMLINGMQEQQAIIDKHQETIDQQQSQIDELAQLVNKLLATSTATATHSDRKRQNCD